MIRPCAQYTGSKKEILRTSEKKRFPVRAAVIQYVPAGTCRLENSHCDGRNHGQLIVSGALVSSLHRQLNAYRSRCKVKGAHSKDSLAALVQDKPP